MNGFRIACVVLVAGVMGAALAACGGDDDSAATPGSTATKAAVSVTASAPASVSPSAAASSSTATTTAAGSTTAASATSGASPAATKIAQQSTPAAQPTPVPPTAASALPQSASIGVVESKIFLFSPAQVTVGVGATVTWGWSNTTQFHNVDLSGPGGGQLATSGEVSKSGSLSYTFTQPGTYEFVCETHEFSRPPMTGTVTVQ